MKKTLKNLLYSTLLVGNLFFSQNLNAQKKIISGVPAYEWHHGCSPTAFGMIAGYYDKNGMPNLISGNADEQTDSVNQSIASDEHYNNFCLPLDTGLMRKPDKSEDEEFMNEYTSNCIADFLKTSYSSYGCAYGESHFDESYAMQEFFKSKNYSCEAESYYYYKKNWEDFKNEIDNKRPVVLDINVGEGHMVTAFGYNNKDTTFAFYNTWDKEIHWEKWNNFNSKIPYSIFEQFYIQTNLDLSSVKFDTIPEDNVEDTASIKDTIIGNFHIRPNATMDYYGSGDINENSVINWEDLSYFEYLLKAPEIPRRVKDRADINGNGKIDLNDVKILKGFLEGSLDYLPSDYNKSLASERELWAERIEAIDKTDIIPPIKENFTWVCGHFATQFCLNTQGMEEPQSPEEKKDFLEVYNFEHYKRFNLPYCIARLSNESLPNDTLRHSMNAILIGNNAKNIKHYRFFEPQNDKIKDLEKDPRMQGGYVYIGTRNWKGHAINFVSFKIENGKAIYNEDLKSPNYPTKIIQFRDTSNLRSSPIYSSSNDSLIFNGLENKLKNKIKIFPTPFEQGFKVNGLEDFMLTIFNMQGKQLYQKNISKDEFVSPNIPSGIYIINLKDKTHNINKKIIKK